MSRFVFLNGRFLEEEKATLHFSDLSIQRGYGAFDFFRVSASRPVFLEDHLDRLFFSAHSLHLNITFNKNELQDRVLELIDMNGLSNCGIKVLVTGGNSPDGFLPGEPNLIMAPTHLTIPSQEFYNKGICLMSYNHQRQLPHVKSIDYLMAIWLQPALQKSGAHDILYHDNGSVLESPRSNIFMAREGKLYTPSDKILKGITRKKIIEQSGWEVIEKKVSMDELIKAEEVMLTSTTKKILPVTRIDGHIIGNGLPGPFAAHLNEFMKSLLDAPSL